jgi:pimeloyl-ACP methyl ester carboxylesterase
MTESMRQTTEQASDAAAAASGAVVKSIQCLSPVGLHRMAYKQWGAPDNPDVVVCVHGLTRIADDFDALAQALCRDFRVVCPDVVGRGRSGRLLNPQLYALPQYLSDMVSLLARVLSDDNQTVSWVGTSMGGLIGMALASLPATPVRKLVLNDIGPSLNLEALQRIGEYLDHDTRFATFDEAAAYVRQISQTFGPHTDAQWHKLASDVLRQDADGKWRRHYDLQLAQPFKAITADTVKRDEALLWGAYDAIACPTLLLRGEQSDLLSHATAQAMTARGPRARLLEFAGVGHAPTLVQDDQIAAVKNFLLN